MCGESERMLEQRGTFHHCDATVRTSFEIDGDHRSRNLHLGDLLVCPCSFAVSTVFVVSGFEVRGLWNPSMPMERPAILNRSLPSTAGVTMTTLPILGRPSSALHRFVNLSMRNAIYLCREKHT